MRSQITLLLSKILQRQFIISSLRRHTEISSKVNSERKDFQLISNDNTVKLDNEIQLNQKDSHASVEYKVQGLSYTINMECGNNEYEIVIEVK